VAVILLAFVLAQATNAAAVAIMSLFVTQSLALPVTWAGIALGLSAGLEIPALVLLGKLSVKYSSLGLLVTGCVVGMAYYVGMALVADPYALLALQALNAWFFASIAGIGLTLFQEIIPRPGLATGLNANARRVGAILTGPIVAIAAGPWGYPGVFVTCAGLTALAAVAAWAAGRGSVRPSVS
jgi:SET family sugar efflux transporter-like MFS transporter